MPLMNAIKTLLTSVPATSKDRSGIDPKPEHDDKAGPDRSWTGPTDGRWRCANGTKQAYLLVKSLQTHEEKILTHPEIYKAYQEFAASRGMPLLPWNSLARHLNRILQRPGQPRQLKMRLVNPKSGRLENTRVYRIPGKRQTSGENTG